MSKGDHLSTTLETLVAFVQEHRRLFVLTGAGASTESGIPGYRDAQGRWTRTTPVYLRDFLQSESARRRYWSRSMAGWPALAAARPNAAHKALARLEADGYVTQLVTQNVDGLHQRAGSSKAIELHGNIHRVTCLDCGAGYSRSSIQQVLEATNAEFVDVPAQALPDGDAAFAAPATFAIPGCAACGGMLKPDVVFFGEGVPKERVDRARRALEDADALLIVGSSLTVYSGYRFCEWAANANKPLAAINRGCTRADPLLALKVSESCGVVLAALAERLSAGRPRLRRSAG